MGDLGNFFFQIKYTEENIKKAFENEGQPTDKSLIDNKITEIKQNLCYYAKEIDKVVKTEEDPHAIMAMREAQESFMYHLLDYPKRETRLDAKPNLQYIKVIISHTDPNIGFKKSIPHTFTVHDVSAGNSQQLGFGLRIRTKEYAISQSPHPIKTIPALDGLFLECQKLSFTSKKNKHNPIEISNPTIEITRKGGRTYEFPAQFIRSFSHFEDNHESYGAVLRIIPEEKIQNDFTEWQSFVSNNFHSISYL